MTGMRWSDKTCVHTEYSPGTSLDFAVGDAAALSLEQMLPVQFQFNNIILIVEHKK